MMKPVFRLKMEKFFMYHLMAAEPPFQALPWWCSSRVLVVKEAEKAPLRSSISKSTPNTEQRYSFLLRVVN